MKTLTGPGGISTFVSLHENRAYETLVERVCKDDISERQALLLQSLVNKNLVKRVIENKKVYYQR